MDRHQPRFDSYSQFFHTVSSVAPILLQSEIPTAVPLKPLNSAASSQLQFDDGTGVLELGVINCYQYQDPSQQWTLASFPGPGVCISTVIAEMVSKVHFLYVSFFPSFA